MGGYKFYKFYLSSVNECVAMLSNYEVSLYNII